MGYASSSYMELPSHPPPTRCALYRVPVWDMPHPLTMELPSRPLPTFTPPTFLTFVSGGRLREQGIARNTLDCQTDRGEERFYCFALMVAG